ncbi:MAG: adenylate/guanylate cyclase domain-containing protein [Deltaproteobacteria bacterium]|nr:adenylate/guanylate cyclase domain-containing protein [Deltaproteobacteria bacterium]
MIRFLLHSALAVFALSAFGVEVCPHLHDFGVRGVVMILGAAFALVVVARIPLQKIVVDSAPPLDQSVRQLWLDLGLFLTAGSLVMVFDVVVFGWPFNSGARIVVGALTLGLFAALDTSLHRERVVLVQTRNKNELSTTTALPRFFSLSRKFAAVTLGLFTLLTIDLLLLAIHDVKTILEAKVAPTVFDSQREVMAESLIALCVLTPLMINLVVAFAGNLRRFLDNQREVLEAVAAGRLDIEVPIASHDEFAFIARRTNQMIEGLRERRRIQELVGKLVSPAIAERLLASKDGFKLEGSRRKVVVLFSDVRNFTTRTESAAPETLVADLNRYFTEMVDVVHAHGGIVDKFIGDGMMAIYGLESFEGAANQAVLSAVEMHRRVTVLNKTLGEPIAIGVGIHAGEVIAGTIGSPNRLEFTFIGDAVNAAARIEGLTKELASSPLVSQTVREALSGPASTWVWEAAGEQALKGKHARLALFKLAATTTTTTTAAA